MLDIKVEEDQFRELAAGGLRLGSSGQIRPVLEATALDAGDTMFNTTEVPRAARYPGGASYLTSIRAWDLDDQTAAQVDLYFFRRFVTLGALDAAPSITDNDLLLSFLGKVIIGSGDWTDLGGAKAASVNLSSAMVASSGLPILIECEPGSTSTWVAAVAQGTPTNTAYGFVLEFGFQYGQRF